MQKFSSSLLNMTINILFFFIPAYGLVVKALNDLEHFKLELGSGPGPGHLS